MSTLLEELETAAADAATTVGAATVAIGRSGRGSGVVVAEGRVLTNAHNLRDRTTQVTFADGRAEQGSLLALAPWPWSRSTPATSSRCGGPTRCPVWAPWCSPCREVTVDRVSPSASCPACSAASVDRGVAGSTAAWSTLRRWRVVPRAARWSTSPVAWWG